MNRKKIVQLASGNAKWCIKKEINRIGVAAGIKERKKIKYPVRRGIMKTKLLETKGCHS